MESIPLVQFNVSREPDALSIVLVQRENGNCSIAKF
jgi:hypothetical protein